MQSKSEANGSTLVQRYYFDEVVRYGPNANVSLPYRVE